MEREAAVVSVRAEGLGAALLLAVLVVVLLAGCASTAPPPPLDGWASMPDGQPVQLDTVRVPGAPEASVGTCEGIPCLAFAGAEADHLEARTRALEANSDVAQAAVGIVARLEGERAALIHAGRLTEERANWLQAREHQAREQLAQERREHLLDNLLHRLVFIIGLAIGGL